mmetsp:Transcript_9223/g.27782  ORF Transcript_9223/g.27782 Transcript_9223/m.27782 type:complete len:291 (+) Transcript_9223:852-1724(+)
MIELPAALFEKSRRLEVRLVLPIEYLLHGRPEPFLPLEDGLFGDDVRRDLRLKASLEEVVREVFDVVVGIVIHHADIMIVGEVALVHNKGCRSILWYVSREEGTLPHILPPSTVLASNRVPLEEDLAVVTQLNAVNVDSITADGDAVPSPPHGTVRRTERLAQSHLLHLDRGRGDGGLLEDGPDPRPGLDRLAQDSVVGLVAGLARQVVRLPSGSVEVRLDPLLQDDVARVVGHFLPGDVHHGRSEGPFGVVLAHGRLEPGEDVGGGAGREGGRVLRLRRRDREAGCAEG